MAEVIDSSPPTVYQIRVQSHLRADWMDWFEGLTITLEDTGNTLLTGPVVDQAALYGLLKKVRDLGMLLISLNPLESGEADVQQENENEWTPPQADGVSSVRNKDRLQPSCYAAERRGIRPVKE